ncbi:MAG: transposase [FCB group bacterium]|nr:transposase [FCB group bacterium]
MEKGTDPSEIKKIFPGKSAALHFLETLRWGNSPVCPHCGSRRITRFKQELRNHCNACNISFSATVNTPFHNTRIPLQKWFHALILLFENNNRLSARRLATEIKVNKNTAWQILSRLKNTSVKQAASHIKMPDLEKIFRNVKKGSATTSMDILQTILRSVLGTAGQEEYSGHQKQ